mgnify:FL=1
MTMQELYKRLVKLAEQRNIVVVDHDNMPVDVGFAGWYMYDQNENFIWIRPSLPLAKKISVLAHELGHFMLHRETGYSILESGTTDNQREREATEYGRRLIRFLISIWNTP